MSGSAARDAGRYRAAHLHQTEGWLSPGYVEVAGDGTIATVAAEAPVSWRGAPIQDLPGYLLPGLPNLHSHAHQRAMAGRAERVTDGRDTFWTWRELMYRFANAMTPDQLEAIAAQVYLEMLQTGFTSVAEFHYLHHDPAGRPYPNRTELSERILAAAEAAGLSLTLLPTLYQRGGIGLPPTDAQRRFIHRDVDAFHALVEQLAQVTSGQRLWRIGIAPHSLRAVEATQLPPLIAGIAAMMPTAPIHLHIAEQRAEVEECLSRLGASPMTWLLANCELGPTWTLIHATHGSPDEYQAVAASGATVGLCPITEANLGDGLFPLRAFHDYGGTWGIGSDSNVRISLSEELRTLEYGQRLAHGQRAILADPGDETRSHAGRRLYDLALAGGARALGQPVGAIRPGLRADLVHLDPTTPALAGHQPATILDGWVFAGDTGSVQDVMVGGTWVIRDGHHELEARIGARFREVMKELISV